MKLANALPRSSVATFLFATALGLSEFAMALDDGTLEYVVANDQAVITGCVETCPSELVIPSSIEGHIVTVVHDRAFQDSSVSSVVIPDTVTSIGEGAFMRSSLTTVSFGAGVTSIGAYAFATCQLTSVVIPDSVTSIGEHSFRTSQLESVVIGSGVRTISAYAFYSNPLTSVVISDGITSIQYNAFQNNQLTSVVIPAGVTAIGSHAFENNQLTEVVIPNSVTSIGYRAFNNNHLSSVDIGDSVTTIASGAFSNNRLNSVVIPDSVTSIGVEVFSHNEIASVDIGNGLTGIEAHAFSYNRLASIIFPMGVTTIGNSAFRSNQLASIVIPSSVTTIGGSAFQSNQLTSVVISDSATTIGGSAFRSNQLSRVVIPASVTDVGIHAFENNQLTSVAFRGDRMSLDAFDENLSLGVVEYCAIRHGWPGEAISGGIFPIVPSPVDCDSDGDGIVDSEDPFPFDHSVDSDGDGVEDSADAFPLVSLMGRVDTDGDGRPNDCDAVCEASGMIADQDDDNDGVRDVEDALPLDATENVDTDGDGSGNNADLDDDGDGVPDNEDVYPLDPSRIGGLPSRLVNISTRGLVGTGDEAMIGGTIIEGYARKRVVFRARGPSLADFGVPGVIEDPVLRIFSGQELVDENDDWQDHVRSLEMPQHLAPSRKLEAAIVTTLAPGAYTAILQGFQGTSGVGIVEIFEVDETGETRLTNISTRGFTGTGDNVLIGGFIIGAGDGGTVTVRARGPSLRDFSVPGVIDDPLLQLFNADGELIDSNDDWQEHPSADTLRADLRPTQSAEAAITTTLGPGAYTAIVVGAGGETGIGIVEVFDVGVRVANPPGLLDRGGGLIYDSDRDITWLADANYAQTSGYDEDGLMSWAEATAWVANLSYYDEIRDVTWSNWRLPSTPVADSTCDIDDGGIGKSYNCSSSEMGHLFYIELSGVAERSILDGNDPDLALFTNIQTGVDPETGFDCVAQHRPCAWYWFDADLGSSRLIMTFLFGSSGTTSASGPNYAWPVMDGDVGSPP